LIKRYRHHGDEVAKLHLDHLHSVNHPMLEPLIKESMEKDEAHMEYLEQMNKGIDYAVQQMREAGRPED